MTINRKRPFLRLGDQWTRREPMKSFRTEAKWPLGGLLLALGVVACAQPAEKTAEVEAPAPAPASQPASAPASRAAAPNAGVSFIFPQDGSTVFTEVDVVMAVSGMTIRPAGEDIDDRTSGHHHILIDQPDGIPAGTVVPADEKSIHFGKGQTTARVTVPEGEHTLTLQLADGAHRSYGPKLSSTITVNVVASQGPRKVSFVRPKDGKTLRSPVTVKMGVSGMTIVPAGKTPFDKTSGHHHLIIDGQPIPVGTPVPADETHIHFGKGQTETKVKLSPGKHTLTLQFADGAHLSYGEDMSSTITVNVR